jgi:transcriptional regulator with XRE-family HTH domain
VPTENELFGAVDALLEQVAQDDLPPPDERKRLREAAGLSQTQIAKATGTRREAVGNWELGKTEPRPPQRAAYARLLEGLAARFPAPEPATEAATEPSVPETFTAATAPEAPSTPAAAKPPTRTAASGTRPTSTSRRPGAR